MSAYPVVDHGLVAFVDASHGAAENASGLIATGLQALLLVQLCLIGNSTGAQSFCSTPSSNGERVPLHSCPVQSPTAIARDCIGRGCMSVGSCGWCCWLICCHQQICPVMHSCHALRIPAIHLHLTHWVAGWCMGSAQHPAVRRTQDCALTCNHVMQRPTVVSCVG